MQHLILIELSSDVVRALISLAFCKYKLVDCRNHHDKHMLRYWHSVGSQGLAERIFSGWDNQDLSLRNGAKNLGKILQVGLGSNRSLPQHILGLLCLLLFGACK